MSTAHILRLEAVPPAAAPATGDFRKERERPPPTRELIDRPRKKPKRFDQIPDAPGSRWNNGDGGARSPRARRAPPVERSQRSGLDVPRNASLDARRGTTFLDARR